MARALPVLSAFVLAASTSQLMAQVLRYGQGCGGAPELRPAAGARLEPGQPYPLVCDATPPGAPGILAFSLVDTSPGVSLAPYGMPGCLLYNDAAITLLMPSTGTAVAATMPLPDYPCRLSIYAQAAVLDTAAPGGLSWSGGVELRLDHTSDVFSHRPTAGTISNNWTVLDHPDLNGEPDAVFLVQPTYTTTSSDIGVWYNHGSERWTIFHQDLAPMTTAGSFLVLLPNSAATQFQQHHVPNVSTHTSRLDHPALNGNPNAVVHVTKLFRTGSGAYNNSPIGVYYDGLHWRVFNQDIAPMPANMSFQVVVADAHLHGVVNSQVLQHSGPGSTVPVPVHEGDRALLFATQHWQGVYNPGHFTFYFDLLITGTWRLQNRQSPGIPAGAAFNVLEMDPLPRGAARQYVSSSGSGYIQLPLIADPTDLFFISKVWNPPGQTGVYNDTEIAVGFYGLPPQHWYLRSESGGAIPVGSGFNLVHPNRTAPTFFHTADATNTTGATTTLDHPSLNGQPNALPVIQPRALVTNDHPTGVQYSASLQRWQIKNLDGAPLPTGKRFQVLGNDDLASELTTFEHTVTSGSLGGLPHVSRLDHPDLNGRPDAVAVITRRTGTGVPANPHAVGVYYDYSTARWAVFNQGFAPLPLGTRFHVLVRRCD